MRVIHFFLNRSINKIDIYTACAINEWIVATIAHGKPIATKPYDVYIFVFVDIGPRDM